MRHSARDWQGQSAGRWGLGHRIIIRARRRARALPSLLEPKDPKGLNGTQWGLSGTGSRQLNRISISINESLTEAANAAL